MEIRLRAARKFALGKRLKGRWRLRQGGNGDGIGLTPSGGCKGVSGPLKASPYAVCARGLKNLL